MDGSRATLGSLGTSLVGLFSVMRSFLALFPDVHPPMFCTTGGERHSNSLAKQRAWLSQVHCPSYYFFEDDFKPSVSAFKKKIRKAVVILSRPATQRGL